MAYTIIAYLKIKKGHIEAARQILKRHAEWVKINEEDTLHYFAYKLKDNEMLVVYERYKDQEAFKTHNQNLVNGAQDLFMLLDGEIKIKILEDL